MSTRPELYCYSVDADIVSIWAAIVSPAEIPDDYIADKFPREWYEPQNQFCGDFLMTGYDEDRVEAYALDDHRIVDISELIIPEWSSYCESFREEAVRRSREVGVDRTSWVFAIYNFHYDPVRSGISESRCMRFVGAFPFVFDLPEYIRNMGSIE